MAFHVLYAASDYNVLPVPYRLPFTTAQVPHYKLDMKNKLTENNELYLCLFNQF